MVVPEPRRGWFEMSPGQGVNNLHIFAIEKKAQHIVDYFFESGDFSVVYHMINFW
jgi:hypothetical protein